MTTEASAAGWSPAGWSPEAESTPLSDHRLSASDFQIGNTSNNSSNNTNNQSYCQQVNAVPTLLYGNTSRFGMVKGSIAARKATAAALRAASASTSQQQHQALAVERIPEIVGAAIVAKSLARVKIGSGGPSNNIDDDVPSATRLSEEPEDCVHSISPADGEDVLGPMGSFKELPKVTSGHTDEGYASRLFYFLVVRNCACQNESGICCHHNNVIAGYFGPLVSMADVTRRGMR